MSIAITEEFNDSRGRLQNYDSYDLSERRGIQSLRHVDIRTFNLPEEQGVAFLDLYTMESLDEATVGDIQNGNLGFGNGHWSGDGVIDQSDQYAYLSLSFQSPGEKTTESITSDPIDLSADFDDTDFISAALPQFPLSSLDIDASSFEFTSDPSGIFGTESSISIPFSDSIVPLIDGDSEWRVLRSELGSEIDLSHVTGVKVTVVSTSSSSIFKMSSLRILSKDWQYGIMDTDTQTGRYRRVPSRNGNSDGVERPNPIVWRSGINSGETDPKPIDLSVGAIFNTGLFETGKNCDISLYFRELTEDFLTQLDLEGYTQKVLDGKVQPDVGDAMYTYRTQEDLDNAPQEDRMDRRTQHDLERAPDYLSASYIVTRFQWGSAGGSVRIDTTETGGIGAGYALNFPSIEESTDYVAFVSLEENSIRVLIHKLDIYGNVDQNIEFDSGRIVDDALIPRRKGRFGWKANFDTSSAYLDSIRSRDEVYAEYRSSGFRSVTPVSGAQLFVKGSKDKELYETIGPSLKNSVGGSTISSDMARTTTSQSWRIEVTGKKPDQGFLTNPFLVKNPENITFNLDIYYPSALLETGHKPKFSFVSEYSKKEIPIALPYLMGDHWEKISVRLPSGRNLLSGSYRILMTQPGNSGSSWWIDNISITDHLLVWEGRSSPDDPWKVGGSAWQPYYDLKNGDNYGILFDELGNQIQTRVRSHDPDAYVDDIQVIPKYASLGRLIWRDDHHAVKIPPDAGFPDPTRIGDKSFEFDASLSSSSVDATIMTHIWYFGDGDIGYGKNVMHQYKSNENYSATLTVVDSYGQRGSLTRVVSV